ncbi:Hypothetical protein FKW44_015417 [Caligus rogercresseyi]|uniref:Uncharacterized protein n=1 Tax=Caligus rogercresseyi TaxID=217165 RepID=A0A7T8JZQ4_CALRO|nr:Hypothetical protein FKW44_015417 [Caligus rogercresseyi]
MAGPESLLPRVRNPIPHHCAWQDRKCFGRGLETPIPHHCAWRDPKVHWPRVRNPIPHHCAWLDPRVLWPRVRDPNTPSLCLAGPESPLAEG